MERKSTNENFEHFLRQNAEEFRMHPSPKVWDGISDNLNKRKRRFYLGLIALLVSSSIAGYVLLDFSFFKLTKNSPVVSTPATSPIIVKVGTKPLGTNETNLVSGIVNNQVIRKVSGDLKIDESSSIEETMIVETPKIQKTQRETWLANLLNIRTNNFLNSLSAHKNSFDFNVVDSKNTQEDNNRITIKPQHKSAKFSWMFFFTPTISYRKLSENKSYLRSVSPIGVPYSYAALYDINSAVTHKPNIGLEFGLTSKYTLTKNIKLRAGLQFNINRYDIKAFKYTPEVATIALNNGSSGVQYVNAGSNYRNFNGGQTDWLQNFYFQISAPVGAEVKLHGNDKMYIGAASTIQPTYMLGDRAYLITSDYKNYAQVPWLVRRWNVNTNLETFVAYSTGKLKWQVGPQVRYQLLSSFVNKYPVKENLFDYGLKVGISVNQKQ